MPATGKMEKVLHPLGCLCCWSNGRLSLDVNVPVSGYAPGQTINVKIDVCNDSKEMVSSNVQLIKVSNFQFARSFGII